MLFLVSCNGASSQIRMGSPDEGSEGDGASTDANVTDVGAGEREGDAGLVDASAIDAASVDATTAMDAGAPLYIAVGYAGRRIVSADGVTWTHDVHDPSPVMGDNDQLIRGIAYANGLYVAVGGGSLVGRINTTADGISWADESDMSGWIGGAAYGSGMWVAVGSSGRHLKSADGIHWIADPERDFSHHYRAIAYGNGVFVAVGDSGKRAMTTDGVHFSNVVIGGDGLEAIAYGNGVFVASGTNGRRVMTPDGITWSNDTSGGATLTGLTFANGMFIATGGGEAYTSTSGAQWSAHTMLPSIDALTHGRGQFVGVGFIDRRLTSPDGLTWSQRASDNGFALTAVVFGGP
jgi:hypothetical protein